MAYKYVTASPDRYALLKGFAKENKKFPTEAESMLWAILSHKRTGYKFNRQHVIGDYIVDFVCLEKDLVIEVDGGYHSELKQMIYDEDRTAALERIGFDVIRFTNDEVLSQYDRVLNQITEYLNNK